MNSDLSIVIPVWNEEKKICADIQSVKRFFTRNSLNGELIISDDGSSDKTIEMARNCSKEFNHTLLIIENEVHTGKGYAVKTGILKSTGRIVMFMDCGGNVPLKYITTGMDLIQNKKHEAAFGSRHLKQSKITKNLVWYRRITSYIFRKTVKYYLQIPHQVSDTQCGFKIFDGNAARNIFAKIKSDGFLFDLEILFIALKNNLSLTEFPIEWTCDRDSRLSVSGNFKSILADLKMLKVRFQ